MGMPVPFEEAFFTVTVGPAATLLPSLPTFGVKGNGVAVISVSSCGCWSWAKAAVEKQIRAAQRRNIAKRFIRYPPGDVPRGLRAGRMNLFSFQKRVLAASPDDPSQAHQAAAEQSQRSRLR